MNKYSNYWNKYYEENLSPNFPSNFAKFCKKKIIERKFNLLEIGCGNGRDSIFFSKHVNSVTCIDKSRNAIKIINKIKKDNYIDNLSTFSGDIRSLKKVINYKKFDLVYMRWFLHSIQESKEDYIFKLLSNLKYKKPIIAIEARLSDDNIIKNKKTKRLSKLELISNGNHYRRLLDKGEFLAKIKYMGFEIIYKKESKNFSRLRIKNSNENPSLIRLIIK